MKIKYFTQAATAAAWTLFIFARLIPALICVIIAAILKHFED